jgi:hypothetical protein
MQISLSRELKKMMEKDGQSSMHRSEHSEEITYSAPETEGIRDQLASVKVRATDSTLPVLAWICSCDGPLPPHRVSSEAVW